MASGPIASLARYPNADRVRLSVTAEGCGRGLAALAGKLLYYSGGPCFLEGTNVETLARYPDTHPAAIRRKAGKGEVILIGVHLERPAPELGDDNAPPPAVAGRLLGALLSLNK
jgi:glutamine amidotransferase-like uncharacterized protein